MEQWQISCFPLSSHVIKSDVFTKSCYQLGNKVQECVVWKDQLSVDINIIWFLNATNKEKHTLWIKKKFNIQTVRNKVPCTYIHIQYKCNQVSCEFMGNRMSKTSSTVNKEKNNEC